MSVCTFCGKSAGLLRTSHQECRDRHDLVAGKIPEFFVRALDSSLLPTRFHELCVEAARSGYIQEDELRRLAIKGIEALVTTTYASRSMTKAEADRIAEIRDQFGLSDRDLGRAAGKLIEARGSAFVAAPRPKEPSIPVITVQQLIDALAGYLSSITTYTHAMAGLDADRSLGMTTIAMYGQVVPQLGRRLKIEADFYGKATTNEKAKLGSEQMIVSIRSADVDLKLDVVVEPQQDHSIAIFRVTRWENGQAFYDRPLS
jgi:hypothetical protein